MSVRLKIILGFVVILVMVSLQSILIITMNNKKDALSSEAQTLYRMNVTLKDQIIDIKTYQTDFLNTIIRKLIVPKETDRQTPTSANIIFAFDEWVDEFIKNPDFQMLDRTRQDLIKEMKPDIKIMKSAVNDLRETDVEKENDRMDIYTVRASISAQNIINSSTEFVKLNSLVLSTKNAKLLEYSKTISMAQYILIAVALLLIMFIIFYSQFLLTPLNWLMEGVSHITKGELSYKVKKRYNDELGKLADQFNLMSDEIRNYRDHLELLVKQRTEQLLEAKEELEKSNENLSVTNRSLEEARKIMDLDMKIASNVQSSLYAKMPPHSEEWDIAFYFRPMAGVSGDMYDFYQDNEGNLLGLSLMDVSGHGIASGLITMIAKSISTRIFTKNYRKPLNKILEAINEELINELGNIDNYLTGIMLKFKGDLIDYVNAGHTELIIRRGDLGRSEIVKTTDNTNYKGLFLGLEAMKTDFSLLTFKMQKDDTLLIFSDCLNESSNAEGEEYGIDRIVNSLNEAPRNDSKNILNHVVTKMYDFTGTDVLTDDLTVICVRRKS